MARDATERTQSRRMTPDMKEQGRKIITHEEFLAQCRDHPSELFNYVADTFNSMIDLASEYRAKIEAAEEKGNQIDDLMAEQDEYKTAYAEAQLRSCGSTVKSTRSSGKSEKVLDPPLLTDGKEPKFEDWMVEMKGKLVANAAHFDNDQMK